MRCSFVVLSIATFLCLGARASSAAERTVADVFDAGEETLWVVEQDGTTIGHCWSRYEGPVDIGGVRTHRFRAEVRLEGAVQGRTLLQQYTTDLWTADDGQPLRVSFRAAVADTRAAVDISFSGSEGEARVRQGPSDRSQDVRIEDGAYVLANNFVSHLDLLLALEQPSAGESATYRLFSANALRGVPFNLEAVEGAEGAVFRDNFGEVLHVDRNGRLELVELSAQKIVFRRTDDADAAVERLSIDPPQPATRSTDFDSEDVKIEFGEVSLAGTITRPKGVSGPRPAVFFISGSGGQDRDGFASGLDLGTYEILDRLTEEGFLVLRVDDRGVGESRGPTADLSYDDLVEDARQAVRFLKSREDVDGSRIALIGHSEGGQTAPILAAEDEIAAVVLMAAPGRNVLELLREQLRRARKLGGSSAEELEQFASELDSSLTRLVGDDPVEEETLPPELRPFLGARSWLRAHAEQDPVAVLKRVRSPVLILQGARDIQVSSERDAPLLEAALEEVGHADHELVIFPELDHLFKKTEGGDSSGLDYLKNRPIDPEFLDTLVAWLSQRLLESSERS